MNRKEFRMVSDIRVTSLPNLFRGHRLTGCQCFGKLKISDCLNDFASLSSIKMDQQSLDMIAKTLDIKYKVLDNLKNEKKSYIVSMKLTNTGDVPLKNNGKWAIYFCHIRMVEPHVLPDPNEICLRKYGIKFCHVNGCLFTIEPLKSFKTLNRGDTLEIIFTAQYYSVARSDLMPNWYITCEDLVPKLIESTCGEELSYVEPFDTPESWKRFDYKLEKGTKRYDVYDPYTPEVRYEKNFVQDLGKAGHLVVPTPAHLVVHSEGYLDLSEDKWCLFTTREVIQEAEFLQGKCSTKFDIQVAEEDDKLDRNSRYVILLKTGDVSHVGDSKGIDNKEAYQLTVRLEEKRIEIVGNSPAGVFYGIQTILAILDNTKVPHVEIVDFPRYTYRGMHLDVSRNFHQKEDIFKLLEVMAMYKMNKFHFHLTDDEGWRLEIPGLEELTTVGSRRGHDLKEKTCILPMLGSGPHFDTSGTGYYSIQDYKEILKFAKRLYIEVIPEIDMPGHSHAAVKAMQARYHRFQKAKDTKAATEFLLSDLQNNGIFQSVQMFSENSMNPGVESTYSFIDKVVAEVKAMHEDIMPLKTFHFGGDEVPYQAWEGSPACESLVKSGKVKSFGSLMEYFVKRVAKVVDRHGLSLGAWQDGLIHDDVLLKPVKRSKFPNDEVYVYAWQNVWESGMAGCAYKLANAGYKVVMSQGTHLYFDHPYEPDPEERGLYWATRYIDTRKTFSFMPDNIYANADLKLTGEVISKEDLKEYEEDNDPLKEAQNVIGMQGQLWTELVRTSDALDTMIHPRLQALAERAWHKASWEDISNEKERKTQQNLDWMQFSNTLGYKEMSRLDKMGVAYHIPPPGAKMENGELHVISAYPGLPLYYSTDSNNWLEVTGKIQVCPGMTVKAVCKSADKKRKSRMISVTIPGGEISQ